MPSPFSQRLVEVASHFKQGDQHLGYRRLLDAAIETDNMDVYASVLSFCDWYDEHAGDAPAVVQQKVQPVLELMQQAYREPKSTRPEVQLKAEGISKHYAKGNFNLSPLEVQLRPGRITGLVGENGNGKTTLLRMLFGELKPDTGNIEYRFRPKATFYEIKTAMAFIPQRPQAWYGGLMDNLQYAAAYTGLSGRNNFLWTEMIIARMGLRPYRSYTWSRISSGYKMRFELARTLIRRPEVLLLDEPLANLDMLAQQIILEDLRFLARSQSMPLTIMLSSQQLYEVEKVSDEVIFLQRGVAKYQSLNKQETESSHALIIELETTASRERLLELLQPHGLQKVSFNGGVFILYFSGGTEPGQVLSVLGNERIPLKYLRDISTSSRRFFDA